MNMLVRGNKVDCILSIQCGPARCSVNAAIGSWMIDWDCMIGVIIVLVCMLSKAEFLLSLLLFWVFFLSFFF
jgi:hypothetical protein